MASILQFNLTGGASNSDPNASLGGAHSSNALSATALNNLFDDVTPEEAEAGDVEYRAIDVTNTGDAAAASVNVYLKQAFQDASASAYEDVTLEWGIEADPMNSTTSIADEQTAPASVTFAEYPDTDTMLALPDIPVSEYARVWIRRSTAAGATNDTNINGVLSVRYA